MKDLELPEGVTVEMIESWKKKYSKSKIMALNVQSLDSEKTAKLIVRTPDRQVIGFYLRHADSNPSKANDIMVNNCVLHGKDVLKNDDDLFFGTLTKLAELIPSATVEAVEL